MKSQTVTTIFAGTVLSVLLVAFLGLHQTSAADPTPTAVTNVAPTTIPSQQPMIVLLTPTALDLPVNNPGFPNARTVGEVSGTITAVVNGKTCASADLKTRTGRDANGNRPLVIGLPIQPKECSTRGALVTLVNSLGDELAVTLTFEPGVTRLVDNLAPKGPYTGRIEAVDSAPAAADNATHSSSGDIPWLVIAPIVTAIFAILLFITWRIRREAHLAARTGAGG